MAFDQNLLDALAAPIPANEIQTIPGSNIRYTSDKFVMDRLDEVLGVGGWEDNYTVVYAPRPIEQKNRDGKVLKVVVGTVYGSLTIRDDQGNTITKSSSAPMEVETGMYGTPDTNGQATLLKRLAMKVGVAQELWKRGENAAQGSSTSSKAASSSKSGASSKSSGSASSNAGATVSASQINWLAEAFGLEEDRNVIAQLTKGKYDAASKTSDGEFQKVLDGLKKARKDDDDFEDNAHDHFVRIVKKVAPRLAGEFTDVEEDYPYDDNDPEE